MACAWCRNRSRRVQVGTSTYLSIPRARAGCCWNWSRNKKRQPRIFTDITTKSREMLLLVTDTSGKQGSVALARAGERDRGAAEVIEVALLAGGMFSAQLVPQIAALLDKHRLTKADIDAFIVVSGPGSFTGLRVGLAAIKALAEVLKKPIVPVSLLEVVAIASRAQGKVVAVLDAGRSDIYVGAYQVADEAVQVLQEELLSKAEFLSLARESTVATPDLPLAALPATGRLLGVRARGALRARWRCQGRGVSLRADHRRGWRHRSSVLRSSRLLYSYGHRQHPSSALLAGREFESSRNKLFIAYTIESAKGTITKRSFKSAETRVFPSSTDLMQRDLYPRKNLSLQRTVGPRNPFPSLAWSLSETRGFSAVECE